VVPNYKDADGVVLNAVEKMIRKTIKVGAPQVVFDGMESGRTLDSHGDINHELLEKASPNPAPPTSS
jgi:hypothetical protein